MIRVRQSFPIVAEKADSVFRFGCERVVDDDNRRARHGTDYLRVSHSLLTNSSPCRNTADSGAIYICPPISSRELAVSLSRTLRSDYSDTVL
jgi:hypothetical protein